MQVEIYELIFLIIGSFSVGMITTLALISFMTGRRDDDHDDNV